MGRLSFLASSTRHHDIKVRCSCASPSLVKKISKAMRPFLAVVHHDEESEFERNLVGLARLLGVEAVFISIAPARYEVGNPLLSRLEAATAVVMSASTWCAIEARAFVFGGFSKVTDGLVKHILVYGFMPNPTHAELAARLSGAAVRAITKIPNATQTSFPRGSELLLGPLSGCCFERYPSPEDAGFELGAENNIQRIVDSSHVPVFLRVKRAASSVFLWAHTDTFPGPETAIAEGDLVRHCDRFVPAIVFLRSAFGKYCWENPLKTARVIIDDPLLRRRYGFIRYEELLPLIKRLGCGVSTAFIPWNRLRTTPRDARFFASFLPEHSLCVHGCDHTRNEFGEGTEDELTAKACAAIARMDHHRDRTGLASSRVMVFPGGLFSTTAMHALRRAGFLAVVNTTRVPVGCPGTGVRFAQELQPAVTCYSGLPLFGRRYPASLEACALDLFLGRPALLVEHHDWFRKGCGDFERCVEWLKAAEPGLAWPTLEIALPQQHNRNSTLNLRLCSNRSRAR